MSTNTFPAPTTTITQEMRNSSGTVSLRSIGVTMNGVLIDARLTYCNWTGGKPYCVAGFTLNEGRFVETFYTQDEAEEAYIARATYVQAVIAGTVNAVQLELNALQAKLNGGWVPEVPMTRPA